ncbi:MAG TPA: hypothetical protein VLG50_05880 [Candidatus Saccharimonadales bacterium]|nr:hypothetical protein [Candidatus Saccharimonadales bacterium]
MFSIPISPVQLHNNKLTEFDQPYYDWVNKYQSEGYDYIISKICDIYMPFFSVDRCCYICREGYGDGCDERRKNVYIWFWKPL